MLFFWFENMILCFWDEILTTDAKQDFKWPPLSLFFPLFKTSDRFEDTKKYLFSIFSTLSVLIFVSFDTAEQKKQRCGQFMGKLKKIHWEIKETTRIALTLLEFVLEEK